MLLYRFLLTLAAPVFALRLLRRERGVLARERLGLRGPQTPPGEDAPKGATLWLHGASNGELTPARLLVEALLARDASLRIIVTCNSLTARDMVAGWNIAQVHVRLAPFDYRWCLRRFLERWQPAGLILVESEFWPNRLHILRKRALPVAVLSARMSERSAVNWQFFPSLMRELIGAVAYICAQDSASEARFRALGIPQAKIGPTLNLKAQGDVLAPGLPADLRKLSAVFSRDKTVLAASTHPGEEEIILNGFAKAQASRPGLRLLLAPRHPRRRDEVIAQLQRSGLSYAVRSSDEEPDVATDVYLVDTLGEMALWYRLAGITFVGGSLVPKGGHTPFEPAAFGSALLHGPHLTNFAEAYAELGKAGGSHLVHSADEFAQAVLGLDGPARAAMTRAAQDVTDALREKDALQPVIEHLGKLLGNPRLAIEPEPRWRRAPAAGPMARPAFAPAAQSA